MKKLFLTGLTALSLTLVMPMAAWGDENNKETVSLAAQAQALKEAFWDFLKPQTLYANKEGVNICQEPNANSKILAHTLLNTSFEVIAEYGGWSMITTEDGYAYIRSECLSKTETIEPTYSEEDLYVLAHVLCGEAQGYPDDEQLYVGSVVLNRVAHPDFPDTIKGVVFQSGQYACVTDGNYYREPTERNWANAKCLLETGSVLPGNIIWQSKGAQGKGVYLKTKWHKYCY